MSGVIVVAYHTIPYHTIPYHTIPYHTLPYPTKPYPTKSYHTLHDRTKSYHGLPYHAISKYCDKPQLPCQVDSEQGYATRVAAAWLGRQNNEMSG